MDFLVARVTLNIFNAGLAIIGSTVIKEISFPFPDFGKYNPAISLSVAVLLSSRVVCQLQVGNICQLHLQGAVRVKQEQQRSAVLHLL